MVDGKAIEGSTFTVSGAHTVSASFIERVQPGDVMYFPGEPGEEEYIEGYLVSAPDPARKRFFCFEGGFARYTSE